MSLRTTTSPHTHTTDTVQKVMLQVIYAMVPGIIAYVYFFGIGVVINIAIATVAAIGAEALILAIRERPIAPFLSDMSAVVTAILLALALPPYGPWWLPVIGIVFAIIIAKHLYGGLGFNPFNPAMIGYATLLISFPKEMTTWYFPQEMLAHSWNIADAVSYIFNRQLPDAQTIDTITSATPLDHLKTQIGLARHVTDITASSKLYSELGGYGWEWINGGFLLGGFWLVYRRIITWQIPAALLVTLGGIALVFHLIDGGRYVVPLFHWFAGATMLGAFFIATDPVTSSTTPRGRIIFGAGVGLLTYIIRTFGGYPDAIAFSVLLMNSLVPMIDYYTRPRVYGHSR